MIRAKKYETVSKFVKVVASFFPDTVYFSCTNQTEAQITPYKTNNTALSSNNNISVPVDQK